MRPLFLFGTLQHRPLLEAVIGDCQHLSCTPAVLPGFRVCTVAEGPFPLIIGEKAATAPGLVVYGLTRADFDALNFYEDPFGYSLSDVTLSDGTLACAYMPPAGKWTADGPWDLSRWTEKWAEMSVIAAREVMSYRGKKSAEQIAFMFPMIRARAWSGLNAKSSLHGAGNFKGRVQVDAHRRPYAHYFALDEFELSHERFDGSMSPRLERAVFRAPDVALVMPYDPQRDCVLLVEQIRLGPLARGDDKLWQLEPIAGRLDAGESPGEAVCREAKEEAGLEIGELIPVSETYCSPGTSSEFYYLFLGLSDLPEDVVGLGGMQEEDEDIRSHILSFDALMELCDGQHVANAPLVMVAYWLARHRERLRDRVGVS